VDRFRIAAIACACLLLAACGGTTKPASIRRPVALRLASGSDGVAMALLGGNACVAKARARTLRSQVAAAIASGSIPRSLAGGARDASARLVSKISCTPAAPAPPPAVSCDEIDARKQALEAEKHGHGEGKKGKGAGAHRKEIDQEERALDEQRKGCK
jgi:hypothetical protein